MPVALQVTAPAWELEFNKRHLRQALRQAGAEVAKGARQRVAATSGAGRKYRGMGGTARGFRGGYQKGKAYQASAVGQAPVSVTRTLARSITVSPWKSGEGVSVKVKAFYGLMLEAGAKGGGGTRSARNVYRTRARKRMLVSVTGRRVLDPRPFLSVELEARRNSITVRLTRSLAEDIEFKKVRA